MIVPPRCESSEETASHGRHELKLRLAAAVGPLVDEAVLGCWTGRIGVEADLVNGRVLKVVLKEEHGDGS